MRTVEDVLKSPGSLLQTVLRQWFWCGSYFMLIRVVISCCFVLYSIAIYLLYAIVDKLPRLGKRELVFLLLFTCSFVVSVSKRFLFLLVLGIGCTFLLWHSLGLPLIIVKWKFSFHVFTSRLFLILYIACVPDFCCQVISYLGMKWQAFTQTRCMYDTTFPLLCSGNALARKNEHK